MTYNLSADWTINEHARLGFAVANLRNTRPHYDATNPIYPYYDQFQFDPIGRRYFIEFAYRFGGSIKGWARDHDTDVTRPGKGSACALGLSARLHGGDGRRRAALRFARTTQYTGHAQRQQNRRRAQQWMIERRRDEFGLAQEKREIRDRQRGAHAPQMPREPLHPCSVPRRSSRRSAAADASAMLANTKNIGAQPAVFRFDVTSKPTA